jgi:hypothetical protein
MMSCEESLFFWLGFNVLEAGKVVRRLINPLVSRFGQRYTHSSLLSMLAFTLHYIPTSSIRL